MCTTSKRQTAANAAGTVTGTPMTAQPVANTAGAGSGGGIVNGRRPAKQGGRAQSAYGSLLRSKERTTP